VSAALAGTASSFEELRSPFAEHGNVLESMADGFIVLDRDFRITFMNAVAEEAYGVTRESAIGKTPWDAFPGGFVGAAIEKGLVRAMAERVPIRGLVNEERAGRWFEVDVHPMRAGGLAFCCRDITDPKRSEAVLLERERQARSEAERQARVKDEFLATMSHELRTPLSAVIGWVGFAREQITDSQAVLKGLEIIERNARAEARLIENLLDLSDIITGKMRVRFEQVDLPLVVAGAIDAVKPSAAARRIRIHRHIEPLTQPVHGDAARLTQVAWNLLSNAIKFTAEGGRVRVVLTRKDSHAELRVSDTGSGIDPGFLPHMFDRFRQADASLTREHGGVGIGLALVKEITELHGGTVSAASEGVGKGATFVVQLPLASIVPPVPASGSRDTRT
jgi:PAS domain S-box-containing protein